MGLSNNPHIQEKDLQALHQELSHWALFCTEFNSELARDVLQQCYLKVLEGKAVFSNKSSLKTWLFSIIRFTAYEQVRNWPPKHIELSQDFETLLENTEDENSSIINLYADKEIQTAIKQLSLLHREIIFLSFYSGHSLSEISKILDVSIGTVRSEYHHAKVKLKHLLSQHNNAEVRYEEKYS